MKKITTIALATMIVSSLSVMPALAADIFSDDSGSALAAGKNAVVSASDISDSGDGSAMMVNWEDGSTAWVSFEAAPENDPENGSALPDPERGRHRPAGQRRSVPVPAGRIHEPLGGFSGI